MTLDVLLRGVHVVVVAAWFGSMIFLALVIVPAARRSGLREAVSQLITQATPRLRALGGTALSLLVLTGTLMVLRRAYPGPEALFGSAFGTVLIAKLSLVALILLLSALHDFVLGPRVARLGRENAESADHIRQRRWLVHLARLTAVLVLAVVFLGVWLTRLY